MNDAMRLLIAAKAAIIVVGMLAYLVLAIHGWQTFVIGGV